MDNDRQISIWSTASGKVLTRFPSFDKAGTRSPNGSPMTFSRDGQLLAVGMVDGLVRVWRTIDGKGLLTLRLKDSVDVVRELTANPPPPNVFISPPRDWGAAPKEIVFNKSGTMLATNNTFSTIIWSVETGKRLAEFNQRHDFLSHALFVGDSGLLMTADSGRMMFRSDLNAEPTIRPGTKSRTTEPVVMSPDERFLAAKGWIDSIFLWSVNGEIPEREINVPAFAMGALAFSPDGNAMAAAGGYNGLYVWDTRTGEPIKSFHNFPGVVSRAWFSADGKAIITYSAFDQRLRIVYVDSAARAAAAGNLLDSLTARQPLRRPMNSPATVGGTVMASQRAIPGAEVTISNGDTPASVVARATTSSGGYFSFPGIRFPHVDIRVRKSGFAPGVKYVHLNIAEDGGTTIIELKPAVGGDGAPGSL
jgi:WD40 repeat protein